MFLTVPGCLEYNPSGDGPDSDSPAGHTETDATVEDACNGLDDDGDGLVDEDDPDSDGDGSSDCAQCSVSLTGSGTVSNESVCAAPPPAVDPWSVGILWSMETGENYGCRVTSVADIDEDGDADVLCVSQLTLYALDGSTGIELWRTDEIAWLSPTAAVDVEPDGDLEILGLDREGRLVVLDGSGIVRRRSNEALVVPFYGEGFAGIQRGSLSVFSSAGIMAAGTGDATCRATGGDNLADFTTGWDDEIIVMDHAVADLDLDGVSAFLTKGSVYDDTGASKASVAMTDHRAPPFPVPVQSDGDPEGEILWMSPDDGAQLVDSDGSPLITTPLPDPRLVAAMACVGDLDGDGWSEVVFADYEYAYAWTPWGVELWRTPIVDATTYIGCTTFDFDGDGAKEVVLGAQNSMYILDGFTGEPHFEAPRSSNTVKDMPLVADVDGDGSADIILSTPGDNDGVTEGPDLVVYSNKNRDWPPGLPYWPYESWSGVGLWPDGTLRDDQDPPWLEYNIWRGQPEWVLWGTDLRAEVVDSCVAQSPADEAEVRLAVRLVNLGPQTAPAGTPLAVYRIEANGSRVLRDVLSLPTDLAAGQASGTWEVVSNRSEAADGFVLVAGFDGTSARYPHDCDESNNDAVWMLP